VVADARSAHVNTTGNPGMATGGSGDVLAGMTAALLVTSEAPCSPARRAVYAMGSAGDLRARRSGGDIARRRGSAQLPGACISPLQNPDR
jgi:NAD(P)H-hydrate epimerase